MAISQFFSEEVAKKGRNFYNARAAQLLCSLDLLFRYVFFNVVVKGFLKSLINKRYADPNSLCSVLYQKSVVSKSL